MREDMKKHFVFMVSLSVFLALGVAGFALAAKKKPVAPEEEVQEPAPEAVPEAAQRYLGQGQAIMERAQSSKDYEEASRAFENAARLAPTWRDIYFNLALAQEGSEKFAEAIKSLRKYLALTPSGEDVKHINVSIYKIEEKMKYKAGPGANERLAQQLTGTWIKADNSTSSLEIEATGAKVRATSCDPNVEPLTKTFDLVFEEGRLVGTMHYTFSTSDKPHSSPVIVEINLSPDGMSLIWKDTSDKSSWSPITYLKK